MYFPTPQRDQIPRMIFENRTMAWHLHRSSNLVIMLKFSKSRRILLAGYILIRWKMIMLQNKALKLRYRSRELLLRKEKQQQANQYIVSLCIMELYNLCEKASWWYWVRCTISQWPIVYVIIISIKYVLIIMDKLNNL